MEKLFKIILDKHPSIYIHIYLNAHKNLNIYLNTVSNLSSSVEIPISNLDDDSFDWESVANILLSSLK